MVVFTSELYKKSAYARPLDRFNMVIFLIFIIFALRRDRVLQV